MRQLILAAAAVLLCGNGAEAVCLRYGGSTSLTGTLASRIFPGPPNYNSVAAGDRPETAFLLKLDRPVCVAAGRTDLDEQAVASIDEIQLVLAKGTGTGRGGRIEVSGELFPAQTGHHHTAVLLDVKTLHAL